MRFPANRLRQLLMDTYANGYYMGANTVVAVCLIGTCIKYFPKSFKKIDEGTDYKLSSHYPLMK